MPNTAGTIIPNNELGSGGVTINIHGDVYDAEQFTEKVAEVLPAVSTKMVNRGLI